MKDMEERSKVPRRLSFTSPVLVSDKHSYFKKIFCWYRLFETTLEEEAMIVYWGGKYGWIEWGGNDRDSSVEYRAVSWPICGGYGGKEEEEVVWRLWFLLIQYPLNPQ